MPLPSYEELAAAVVGTTPPQTEAEVLARGLASARAKVAKATNMVGIQTSFPQSQSGIPVLPPELRESVTAEPGPEPAAGAFQPLRAPAAGPGLPSFTELAADVLGEAAPPAALPPYLPPEKRGLVAETGAALAGGAVDALGMALKDLAVYGGPEAGGTIQALENVTGPKGALAPGALAQDPETLTGMFLGGMRSLVPSMVPAVAGVGTGAGVGAFSGPGVGAAAGTAAAAAAGAAFYGGATYYDARKRAKKWGLSDEDAKIYGVFQALAEAVPEAVFGAVASTPGGVVSKEFFKKAMRAGLGKALAGVSFKDAVKNPVVKQAVANVLTEMGTEATTAVAQSTIDKAYGLPDDGASTLAQAGAGGFGALPVTIVTALGGKIRARRLVRDLSDGAVDPRRRAEAAAEYIAAVKGADPALAATLEAQWVSAIDRGEAIDLGAMGDTGGVEVRTPADLLRRTDEAAAKRREDRFEYGRREPARSPETPQAHLQSRLQRAVELGVISAEDAAGARVVPESELDDQERAVVEDGARRGRNVVVYDGPAGLGRIEGVEAGRDTVFVNREQAQNLAGTVEHEISHTKRYEEAGAAGMEEIDQTLDAATSDAEWARFAQKTALARGQDLTAKELWDEWTSETARRLKDATQGVPAEERLAALREWIARSAEDPTRMERVKALVNRISGGRFGEAAPTGPRATTENLVRVVDAYLSSDEKTAAVARSRQPVEPVVPDATSFAAGRGLRADLRAEERRSRERVSQVPGEPVPQRKGSAYESDEQLVENVMGDTRRAMAADAYRGPEQDRPSGRGVERQRGPALLRRDLRESPGVRVSRTAGPPAAQDFSQERTADLRLFRRDEAARRGQMRVEEPGRSLIRRRAGVEEQPRFSMARPERSDFEFAGLEEQVADLRAQEEAARGPRRQMLASRRVDAERRLREARMRAPGRSAFGGDEARFAVSPTRDSFEFRDAEARVADLREQESRAHGPRRQMLAQRRVDAERELRNLKAKAPRTGADFGGDEARFSVRREIGKTFATAARSEDRVESAEDMARFSVAYLDRPGAWERDARRVSVDPKDIASARENLTEVLEITRALNARGLGEPTAKGAAIVKNMDTGRSVDFDALCPKAQPFTSAILAVEKRLGRNLKPEERIRLATTMDRKGLVTPCGYCYVVAPQVRTEKFGEGAMVVKPTGKRAYSGQALRMSDTNWSHLNFRAGLRFLSLTDMRAPHLLGHMTVITDAALRGGKGFAYTKQPLTVEVFGNTGLKINGSLFATGTGRNIRPHEKWGLPWDLVKGWHKKYPNVGGMMMASNDDIIRWAGQQEWVGQIIPAHVRRGLVGLDRIDTYEREQSDHWADETKRAEAVRRLVAAKRAGRNSKAWSALKPLEAEWLSRYVTGPDGGAPLMGQIKAEEIYKLYKPPIGEAGAHGNDMQRFLELAREYGLTPRFERFSKEPWYIKLITDVARWDTPHEVLRPEFDTAAAVRELDRYIAAGGWQSEVIPVDEAMAIYRESKKAGDDTRYMVRAFHGGPHKIDKRKGFSLGKVGTGEGAAAYGWGAYFASLKDVAEGYKERLSNDAGTVARKIIEGLESIKEFHGLRQSRPISEMAQQIINEKGDIGKAMTSLRDLVRMYRRDGDAKEAAKYQATYDSMQKLIDSGWTVDVSPGYLYHAELDVNDEDLLDWDKPLSEQSEKVREVLRSSGLLRKMSDAVKEGWTTATLATATGQDLYDALRYEYRGGRDWSDAARLASETLKNANIPGIRYLDQGSRDKGKGTYNYVIFDDRLIDLTHRNDEPLYSIAPPGFGPRAGDPVVRAARKNLFGRFSGDEARTALNFFLAAVPELGTSYEDRMRGRVAFLGKDQPRSAALEQLFQDVQKTHARSGKHIGDWGLDLVRAEQRLSRADQRWLKENADLLLEEKVKAPTPAIAAWFKAARALTDRIAEASEKAGLKVWHPMDHKGPDGQWVGAWRPWRKLAKYFPHTLTAEARTALENRSGELFEAIKRQAKTEGIDFNFALQVMNRDFETRRHGSLEHVRLAKLPREVTLPGGQKVKVYRTDGGVIHDHLDTAARRIAIAEIFGPEAQLAAFQTMLERARGEGMNLRDAERMAVNVWNALQGVRPTAPFELNRPLPKRIWGHLEDATTLLLSMAVIGNVTTGGAPLAARGGLLRSNRELIRALFRSGTQDYDHLRRLAAISGHLRRDLGVTEYTGQGKIGETTLKWTGFNKVNDVINLATASVANQMLEEQVMEIRRRGRRAEQARRYLVEEGGFSDADVREMADKGITDDHRSRAISRLVEQVNAFRQAPTSMTSITSQPWARYAFAFSSWVRQQHRTFRYMAREALRGNWAPMSAGLPAYLAGEALNQAIRNALKDRDREDEGAAEWLASTLVGVGALGVANSFTYALRHLGDRGPAETDANFKRLAWDTLTPPQIELLGAALATGAVAVDEARRAVQGKPTSPQRIAREARFFPLGQAAYATAKRLTGDQEDVLDRLQGRVYVTDDPEGRWKALDPKVVRLGATQRKQVQRLVERLRSAGLSDDEIVAQLKDRRDARREPKDEE